jgi:hypothetical protein
MAHKLRESKLETVFGVPLEDLLKSAGQQPTDLPRVAGDIIDYLKKKGAFVHVLLILAVRLTVSSQVSRLRRSF